MIKLWDYFLDYLDAIFLCELNQFMNKIIALPKCSFIVCALPLVLLLPVT